MLKINSLPAHSRSMNWRKIIFFTFWKFILFEQTEDRWWLELISKAFFVFLEIVSVWRHFGNLNFQPCVHLVVTNSVNKWWCVHQFVTLCKLCSSSRDLVPCCFWWCVCQVVTLYTAGPRPGTLRSQFPRRGNDRLTPWW